MLRLVISLTVVTLLSVSCEERNDQQQEPCPTIRPCICNGIVVPHTTPSLPHGVSPAATSSSEESSEEKGPGHTHGQGNNHNHGQGQENNHNHGQGQENNHNHGQGQENNPGQGQGHSHGHDLGQDPNHGHDHGQGPNHGHDHGHDHSGHRCPPQPPCICPHE